MTRKEAAEMMKIRISQYIDLDTAVEALLLGDPIETTRYALIAQHCRDHNNKVDNDKDNLNDEEFWAKVNNYQFPPYEGP